MIEKITEIREARKKPDSQTPASRAWSQSPVATFVNKSAEGVFVYASSSSNEGGCSDTSFKLIKMIEGIKSSLPFGDFLLCLAAGVFLMSGFKRLISEGFPV